MAYFRQLHVNLRPPAAEALDYLVENKEMSQVDLISTLLIKEAAKHQLKKEQETDNDE